MKMKTPLDKKFDECTENRHCNGIINCKYDHGGECDFFYMGSGNKDDMPCISNGTRTVEEFRQWEEEEKGLKEASYSEGWMDGYNHAMDRMFEELNYLLKNHVIEELRKRIKR